MALLRIQVLASSSPTLARLRPGVETIALAIDEARARRLHDEVAQGHYLLSIVHQEAGRLDVAQRATLDAAEAARRSDRLGHARQLGNSARCLVELGRDIGHARALVGQALALADAAGEQEIELLWCQGLLQHWDGELGPALASLDRAIALAAREEDRWRHGRCLAAAPMIELERQSPGAALARADVLAQATQGPGDGAEGPLAVALAAIARRMAAGPAPPVAAALEDLRAPDDKSRLAAVLNAAAAAEQSRHNGAAAGAYATEALAVAQAIGDRSEAVVAQAILARLAPTVADGRRARTMRWRCRRCSTHRKASASVRRAPRSVPWPIGRRVPRPARRRPVESTPLNPRRKSHATLHRRENLLPAHVGP